MAIQENLLRHAWLFAALLGLLSAATLYGGIARSQKSPEGPGKEPPPPGHWPVTTYPAMPDWRIFQTRQTPGAAPSLEHRSAKNRFRLAGTFFEVGATSKRQAILDDLSTKHQILIAEGGIIADNIKLACVLNDRVLLDENGRQIELLLSFADPVAAGLNASSEADGSGQSGSLSSSRFGVQIETNRWVFSRQQILDYYQEVFADKVRLANIFASMKPVYDEEKITGYVLDVEGERDFFQACGLHEGDVVRKVNSMPMTNRSRAEYFIKEFVEDRANAFVLEIERDGHPARLIYMIR